MIDPGQSGQIFGVDPPSLEGENAGSLFCPGRARGVTLGKFRVLIQMRVEESRDRQMEDVTIRRAVPGDAELLAELGTKIFRDTFAEFNTVEDMAEYLSGSFSPAIQAAEIAEPDSYFLIATIGDEPAGYARLSFGPPPEGARTPDRGMTRPLEIVRFYVDSRWHGRGIAAELMRSCLAEARREGGDLIWLAVWKENPRAISFYRKWGFGIAGEKIFQLGSDPQTDLVMIRMVEE